MKRWLVAAAALVAGACGGGAEERSQSDWEGHRLNFQFEEDCGEAPCHFGLGSGGFWFAVSQSRGLVRIAGYPDELSIVDGRAEIAGSLVLADYLLDGRWVRYALDSLVLTFDDHGAIAAVEGAGLYEGADDCSCDSECLGSEQGSFAIGSFEQAPFVEPQLRLATGTLWPGSGGVLLVSSSSPWKLESAQLEVGARRRHLLDTGEGGFDWPVYLEGIGSIDFGESTELTVRGRDFADRAFEAVYPVPVAALLPGERSPGFEEPTLGGYAASGIAVVERGSLPGNGSWLAVSANGRLGFPVAVPASGGSLVLDAWAVGGSGQLAVSIVGEGASAFEQLELDADQRIAPVELPLGDGTATVGSISERTQFRQDLSAWAGKEIAVVITMRTTGLACGTGPTAGLLLDDVRVEP